MEGQDFLYEIIHSCLAANSSLPFCLLSSNEGRNQIVLNNWARCEMGNV